MGGGALMARLNDADLTALLKERGDLPEEGGFHSQEGLFFRRLDDGRVRVSVVEYAPVRGSATGGNGDVAIVQATVRRLLFTTVLTPFVWASIAASTSFRDEDASTWSEAYLYHMGVTPYANPATSTETSPTASEHRDPDNRDG